MVAYPATLNRKLADMHQGAVSVLDPLPVELPCRVADPELFFAETPADVEQAKALCLDCPVRLACLSDALGRREPWGVWGGQLFVQGVVVARKRPRGRPRKHPVPEEVAA